MGNLHYCCQSYLGVFLLIIILFSLLMSCLNTTNASIFPAKYESQPEIARPSVVNVGVLLAFNSTIGRVAKAAMELAVKDVNNNQSLFDGTKLELNMMDSNCSAFIGMSTALELLKKDVVAIIGPQSSVLAHVASHLAKELKIPLVSFAATDPTLTSNEYPYFIRMAHSDFSQMSAIAAIVGYYYWRQVVVVCSDDDYGRNGVYALEDALVKVGSKISNKVAILPDISKNEMGNILANLALVGVRVIVVHVTSDVGLTLFHKAKEMGMLSRGYVWMVTDWLSSVLDSAGLAADDFNSLHGVIGLRRQIPRSGKLDEFRGEWKRLQSNHTVDVSLNVFGLYAYDSVVMIAHSINAFLNQAGNFSFAELETLSNKSGSYSQLAALKVFQAGAELRKIILETNFTGVSGPVQLDENRGLMGPAFEIINIAGTGFRSIGYWSENTGLSVTPPEYSAIISQNNQSHELEPELHNVIWPGESKQVPRGWTFADHGRELVIGVPKKKGFDEFVSTENDSQIPSGFCIDVFLAAVNLLPYAVPHTFTLYSTSSYDDLVEQVFLERFDAVIGDVSIVANRTRIVDFTQPYVVSGLAVVVPIKDINPGVWAFMRPFTMPMWFTTGGFFVFIGIVVWLLEHRSNPEFRGQPRDQVMTVLWFAFSTTFFAHRENTVSVLGRAVVIVWLFVVLIINASYTASLTSFLTVERLSSTIKGIDSLIKTNDPIGYQAGSYVAEYLSREFKIGKHRLVPLETPDSYSEAMSLWPKKGGVVAVVDELPYIESFLSTRCDYEIVGRKFTQSGWGFVFPKHSELAVDMSTAILALSESGELEKIHDKWFKNDVCSPQGSEIPSVEFGLESFWGLFLIIGIVCFVALFVFFCRMICEFTRKAESSYKEESPDKPHSITRKSTKVIRSFVTFVGEREDSETERRREREKEKGKEKELSELQSISI